MSLNNSWGKVLILILRKRGMDYSWPLMENTIGDREKSYQQRNLYQLSFHQYILHQWF